MNTEANKKSNLDLVSRFLGWGNPACDIWFVALEEQAPFNLRYLALLREREMKLNNGRSEPFWQTGQMASLEETRKPSPIGLSEESILASLYRPDDQSQEPSSSRELLIWKYGFHCNLYALGHQRGTPLENTYWDLFGIRSVADESFREATLFRHSLIRQLRVKCAPRALLCMGLTERVQFAKIFDAKELQEVRVGPSTRIFVDSTGVIVAPHGGQRTRAMFKKATNRLIATIGELGVRSMPGRPAE